MGTWLRWHNKGGAASASCHLKLHYRTEGVKSHAETPELTGIPVVQLLQRYVVLCRDGQARVVRPDHVPGAAVRQRPDAVPDLVHTQVERPLHVPRQAKPEQLNPGRRMYRDCLGIRLGTSQHVLHGCWQAHALALAAGTQLPTHHGHPPSHPARRLARTMDPSDCMPLLEAAWATLVQHVTAGPPLLATPSNCTPSSSVP